MLPPPTSRLRFRKMNAADLDEVEAVLSAADPVRSTRRPRTRADAERWIDWNLSNYSQHGFGLWVIEAHDGSFIGDCGSKTLKARTSPRLATTYTSLVRQGSGPKPAGGARHIRERSGSIAGSSLIGDCLIPPHHRRPRDG